MKTTRKIKSQQWFKDAVRTLGLRSKAMVLWVSPYDSDAKLEAAGWDKTISPPSNEEVTAARIALGAYDY